MAIITPALLSALKTGFMKQFQDGLASAESAWNKIATEINSTTASNTYGWLGQFPTFREWVGDRVIKDMAAQGYQITNKLWESTVGVARTDIEDDNLGIYSPLFTEMGRAAGVQPDELVFALLKAGNSTLCYDGQYFFDTDHPVYPNVDGTGTAGTVSNNDVPGVDPQTPWYLLDTSRSLKPLIFQRRTQPELQALTSADDEAVFTSDTYRYGVRSRCNVGFGFWQMAHRSQQALDATSFNAAVQAMQERHADGGRPLGIRPTLLVVPPSLRAAALEVVKAERLANGATNVNREMVDVLVSPWVM